MPTYEYHCRDCEHTWERSEHIADHGEVTAHAAQPPVCPNCSGERAEPVLSAFFAKTGRKS
jgi:putative FmdB family regulatory protein